MRWWQKGDDDPAKTLGDLQTEDVFLGYADELVGELANRMALSNIGRVPIVERATGKLVGLVARRDLLRVRAQTIKEERERRRLLRLS
jgi:CBS domain-containing protein